ncbi:MAG TPA: hypothetical protein VFS91_01450 [Nitrobacter sp.]|nr:hypothetical protein [Nitrobacter sp.]
MVGWIARFKNGSIIPDPDYRFNSRSTARVVVAETRLLEKDCKHTRWRSAVGGWSCVFCGEFR